MSYDEKEAFSHACHILFALIDAEDILQCMLAWENHCAP